MTLKLWPFRLRKWVFWFMAIALSLGVIGAVDSPCESFRVIVSNQSRVDLTDVAIRATPRFDDDTPALWRGPLAPRQTRTVAVHEPSWVNPFVHPFINARVAVRWGGTEPGEAAMDFNYALHGAQAHFVMTGGGPVAYIADERIRSAVSDLGSLLSLLVGFAEWSRCSWRTPSAYSW